MAERWTAAKTADLERFWLLGWSAAAIGREIGMTKSAVIGKVHRLGLPGRPSPIKRKAPAKPKLDLSQARNGGGHARRADASMPTDGDDGTAEEMPVARVGRWPGHAPTVLGITSFRGGGASRARTCQWIAGDPSADDACKCGKPTAPGSVYCPDHLARAFTPRTAEQDIRRAKRAGFASRSQHGTVRRKGRATNPYIG